MANKLFVGNLAYSVTEEELTNEFSAFGEVTSAKLITDRDSGRSKGFAFVEMSTDEEAAEAIKQMNGKEISGRAVVVSEAKPQQPRENRGSFRSNNRY